MIITCECNRVFASNSAYVTHKKYCKGIKIDINVMQTDYDSGLTLKDLMLKYHTSQNFIVKNIKMRNFSESRKMILKKYPNILKHSDKTKEKMRQSRFNYLKKKNGNTPWERRQKREFSYLENWFKDNIILKYSLQNNYDIIYEYSEYPYFIDFAFLNIKLAIELDGKCHFINGNERLQHDIKKDELLVNKGWSVYRIKFDQIESKITIDKFINFLNTFNNKKPKVYGDDLYSYNEVKNKRQIKKENDKNKKEKIKNLQIIKNIELILQSNIDFSKFGWVQKIASILNKKPQKINKFMKKYMLDFYNNSCFKREKK